MPVPQVKGKNLGFVVHRTSSISPQQLPPVEEDYELYPARADERAKPLIQEEQQKRMTPDQGKRETSTYSEQLLDKPKPLSSSVTTLSLSRLLIGGAIVVGVCIVIILAIVLPIVLTRNPTVTNATPTSTAAPIVASAYWGFDNDANDLYGVYNGALTNGATFSNSTYFGYGFNLMLNNTNNQSVLVASPFFNLSYTSFTIEAWIFGQTLTGDNAIFSQCQCTTCQDQCLFLIIRNGRMYMGFTLDDLVGVTTLSANTWTHVAFVYDHSTRTQSVYVQGILDNSRTSLSSYQGQNGSIVIGSSHLSSSGFNGFIDNLKLTTRAKSAKEILDAASMVTYYSFDGTILEQDMGPNQMNGTLSNAAAVSGRIGQALAFSGAASSYLQSYGYFQLGRSNQPFSFSLWIFPYSVNGGVLIQKSVLSTSSGGWCYTLMGLTTGGQIVNIIYTSNVPIVVGPVISVRTWTHIGYTYSTTNGLRLYVNGVLFGSTGPVGWSSSGTIDWLSIGSFAFGYCGPSVLSGIPYQGAIDEFYVYRRELTASEITTLANP